MAVTLTIGDDRGSITYREEHVIAEMLKRYSTWLAGDGETPFQDMYKTGTFIMTLTVD